ncbi:acetyltransferase [Pontibacillus halophilus JSM 076056 = DSM 19796]|uniref:Acetyltransferase n=1 Tax=Pontibacillus halophilus JSM 076056 = DSM 19796 TaxID=1385510 RepID=A0A0A5GH32_9BACI|nr:GNAT family protein [Pontibacillus halophilus]KGX92546.1 acetyltransferase [Pontibacillus halophilus JSM 076056 = DSM 19796]
MLKGNLVELRPVKEEDLERVNKWNNDEELTRLASGSNLPYQLNNPHESLKAHYTKNLTSHNLLKDGIVFSIYATATSEQIGKCDYREFNPITRCATVGIVIGEKEYWGRGYGKETIHLLCRHLFYDLNVNRIQLDTWSGNERAVALYKACGFRLEGRLRRNEYVNGEYHDTLILGLLQEEFTH